MKTDTYSMSFTTGSLLQHESLQLAALYLQMKDWEKLRKEVVDNNLLQSRTLNTLKRTTSEIISRLKTLTQDELELLAHTIPQQQAYVLWLAVCRRYQFIREFAVEVLRERYLTLKKDLPLEEFDAFFNRKSDWHDGLNRIKPVTCSKLRQTLYKMLKESGLVDSNFQIQPALLSPETIRVIQKSSLAYFPTGESQLVGVGV